MKDTLSRLFFGPKNMRFSFYKDARQKGTPWFSVMGCFLYVLLVCNCAAPAPGNWVCEVEITSSGPYDLTLFYRSDEGQAFDASRRVEAIKTDRSHPTAYKMVLPDTVSLIDVRLDLGSDSVLKHVQIHKVVLENQNGRIEISAEELPLFFSLNTFATFGTEPGTIRVAPKNRRFDPFLSAKPILQHRLKMSAKGIWP